MGSLILPDADTHFIAKQLTEYQREVYDRALEYCTGFRTAIDVGAHVGIFTVRMEEDFEKVHAFEPQDENYACLKKNTASAKVYKTALLEGETSYFLENPKPTNSGVWEVRLGGLGTSSYLDFYDFQDVDLIKIDVQLTEGDVILGAVETIDRNSPVLIVEDNLESVAGILKKLNYVRKEKCRKDSIFVRDAIGER